jgi:hypothetical protein
MDTLLYHNDVIVNAGGLIDIKAAISAHTKTSRHLQVRDIKFQQGRSAWQSSPSDLV